MGHDSNRIYSPIGIEPDVYGFFCISKACTNGKYSISRCIAYLCSKGLINIWARNKPEAIGGYEDLSDDQRKSNNFGLRPPAIYTNIAEYVTLAHDGVLLGWIYDYPKIGIHWFRPKDFDNYRADSQCPFPSYAGADCIIYTNSQGLNEIKILLSSGYQGSTGNTDYINLSDLQMVGADFANWYSGLLILKDSDAYWMLTSDGTLTEKLEITLNTAEHVLPSAGSYKCYVFLANKKFKVYSKSGTAVSGGLQIIPITAAPVIMKVVTSAGALTVFAVFQTPRKLVVTVTNMNASQVVITPQKAEHASGNGGTGTVKDLATSLEAITVPAGSGQNPQMVTKTYTVQPLLSGSVRLIYKQTIGSGTQSGNLYTPWTDIVQMNL